MHNLLFLTLYLFFFFNLVVIYFFCQLFCVVVVRDTSINIGLSGLQSEGHEVDSHCMVQV